MAKANVVIQEKMEKKDEDDSRRKWVVTNSGDRLSDKHLLSRSREHFILIIWMPVYLVSLVLLYGHVCQSHSVFSSCSVLD